MNAESMRGTQVSGIVTDLEKRTEAGVGNRQTHVWNFTFEFVGADQETHRVPVELTAAGFAGNIRNGDKVRLNLSDYRPGDTLTLHEVLDDNGYVLVAARGLNFASILRWAHRHPRWAALTVVVLLAGAGLVGTVGWKLFRRRNAPARSWCVGLESSWETDCNSLHQDNQTVRAMLDENCKYWAITAPDPHVRSCTTATTADTGAHAPESWCLALKTQWTSQMKDFNEDNLVTRAELKEQCGVDLPAVNPPATTGSADTTAHTGSHPHPQAGSNPSSWCIGLRQQWQVRKDTFHMDDQLIRSLLKSKCNIDPDK